MSRRASRALVAAMFTLLLVGTLLAFETFDRGSRSASDTLRPFLITMLPIWLVALAAARTLLRQRKA